MESSTTARGVNINPKTLTLATFVLLVVGLIAAGCLDYGEGSSKPDSGSNGSIIGPTADPTAPPLAITPVIVYTLKEAHGKFGTDLPVPSYLPDGYSFSYALQYGEPDNRISLIYAKEGDELRITQVPVPGNPCPGQKTTGSVGVTIDGTNGTFTPGGGENVLRWNDSRYAYCLSGTHETDEMVAIAASVDGSGRSA
ncbi:MAG: hypothetical protein PWR21_875 [Methanoculleus sp.]|nr:hypothetical protein [Methanoculleus sp.]